MVFKKEDLSAFCASLSDRAFVGPSYEIKAIPAEPEPTFTQK